MTFLWDPLLLATQKTSTNTGIKVCDNLENRNSDNKLNKVYTINVNYYCIQFLSYNEDAKNES